MVDERLTRIQSLVDERLGRILSSLYLQHPVAETLKTTDGSKFFGYGVGTELVLEMA